MNEHERTITEADAELIADKLRDRLAKDLQLEVGGAVIKWIRKVALTLVLMIFAYGIGTGKLPAVVLENSR